MENLQKRLREIRKAFGSDVLITINMAKSGRIDIVNAENTKTRLMDAEDIQESNIPSKTCEIKMQPKNYIG
ncbi:MAG TPA: hypothetical protein VJH65_03610 [Candidatus Nanoarchaeia archaeon]|nr:hypothetical protein [Candidatus Woesearchaeota archaeon]HLC87333.1 hypothetical protein [Candidatus Nanoarchaeia archaeon]